MVLTDGTKERKFRASGAVRSYGSPKDTLPGRVGISSVQSVYQDHLKKNTKVYLSE
jgi:hypothetical protein